MMRNQPRPAHQYSVGSDYFIENLSPDVRVDRGEGVIEQINVSVSVHSPGHGNPLLLATWETKTSLSRKLMFGLILKGPVF